MTLPKLSKKTFTLKSRAFTLIELLIVITIISVLLGAISFSYSAAQRKGRDGKRKADLKAVQQALETYFTANGEYPMENAGLIRCQPDPYDGGTIVAWGDEFKCVSSTEGTTSFLGSLPKDPNPDPAIEYYYWAESVGLRLTYQIEAMLENDNDPDYKPPEVCDKHSTSFSATYCVYNP